MATNKSAIATVVKFFSAVGVAALVSVSCSSSESQSQQMPSSSGSVSSTAEVAETVLEVEGSSGLGELEADIAVRDGRTAAYLRRDANGEQIPSETTIKAVLSEIDTNSELEWASGHVRILTNSSDGQTPTVAVRFNCSAPELTSRAEVEDALFEAIDVDGGGDCYGWAVFGVTGELIEWAANGES